MKVLMKKFTVIAAAFAMLFAVSSCSDPNGKANPDKKTGDNTTTAAAADAASDAGSTSGGEQSGGSGSGGQGSGTGGGGETTQTKTVVADFEDLSNYKMSATFYSDNTWKLFVCAEGEIEVWESGTYTGNPAQDGAVEAIVTEKVQENSEADGPEPCDPVTMNLTITDGIVPIEEDGDVVYFIRKANEITNFRYFLITDQPKDDMLIKYAFYDDNTFRLTNCDMPTILGTYEGDPSKDGQIEITIKYTPDKKDPGQLTKLAQVTTLNKTISDDCLNGIYDEPAGRELAIYTANVTQQDSSNMDFFVYFYANDSFYVTYEYKGWEFSHYYGTYTESTTAEGPQEIELTFVKQYNENDEKWEDIDVNTIGQNPYTTTIDNDQFTWYTIDFTRQ